MSALPAGGKIQAITRWGEPVMHKPCREVTSFDAELRSLVADMVATMYAAEGVGLAANQIGVGLKVFVFDCPDADGHHHTGVVCNPTVRVPVGRDRVLDDDEEGCLSLPGAFVACARTDTAEVRGIDLHGRPTSYAGDGLLARCLQHEADHLDGIVFADRLSTKARKKLYKEAARLAGDFPSGWPTSR